MLYADNIMDNPKKILVVQLRRIGDVILTIPVVDVLRKNFPDATIDFLVEKSGAEILKNNPAINSIHQYDPHKPLAWISAIRKQRYDWVLDFLGNPRTAVLSFFSGARLTVGFNYFPRGLLYRKRISLNIEKQSVVDFKMNLLKALGCFIQHNGPKIYVTENEKQKAFDFLSNSMPNRGSGVIGIAPGSRRWVRRWPAESYAHIADWLIEKYACRVIVLWGSGDEDVVETMRRTAHHSLIIPPLVPLRELAAIISLCKAVIANSNGPMHIAEACSVTTLTMYGPNNPYDWESGYNIHAHLRAENLDCIGCNNNTCDKELLCMKSITPEMVQQEFTKLWSKSESNFVHSRKIS